MNVSLNKICKFFGQKKALEDVSLTFAGGKIHALLGENGAGKTTLASVLCGAKKADFGEMAFDGRVCKLKNEADALSLGITRVNQNPLLAEDLSARDNIMIGKEILFRTKSERKNLCERVGALFEEWCPALDDEKKVRYASADERFFISLVSSLCIEPKLLILDEPCSRLDFGQRKIFYENLKRYVSSHQYVTVILITHSMIEAVSYADTITVLVKGKVRAVYDDVKNFNRNDFSFSKKYADSERPDKAGEAGKNSGGDAGGVTGAVPPFEGVTEIGERSQEGNLLGEASPIGVRGRLPPQNILKVENLYARPKDSPAILECSFEVQKNKITLISGQQESGLSTLENILTGMADEKARGFVHFYGGDGEKIINLAKKMPDARLVRSFLREGGTGILPTDKHYRGSNPGLTVEQLLTATVKTAATRKLAEARIEKAGVQILPDEKVSSLSGGMLQKLMIEKELSGKPDFLILCNPLQGLDFNAESFFVSEMKRFVAKGKTILVLSSAEFPEGVADEVYFLEGGVLRKKGVE